MIRPAQCPDLDEKLQQECAEEIIESLRDDQDTITSARLVESAAIALLFRGKESRRAASAIAAMASEDLGQPFGTESAAAYYDEMIGAIRMRMIQDNVLPVENHDEPTDQLVLNNGEPEPEIPAVVEQADVVDESGSDDQVNVPAEEVGLTQEEAEAELALPPLGQLTLATNPDQDGSLVSVEQVDMTEYFGIDPTMPTSAKPGTEDKVMVLTARYAAGVALWHPHDASDQSPVSEKYAVEQQVREAEWRGDATRAKVREYEAK